MQVRNGKGVRRGREVDVLFCLPHEKGVYNAIFVGIRSGHKRKKRKNGRARKKLIGWPEKRGSKLKNGNSRVF